MASAINGGQIKEFSHPSINKWSHVCGSRRSRRAGCDLSRGIQRSRTRNITVAILLSCNAVARRYLGPVPFFNCWTTSGSHQNGHSLLHLQESYRSNYLLHNRKQLISLDDTG